MLQETIINYNINLPLNYKICSPPIRNDGLRGVAILINKQINYRILHLKTNLQTLAIKQYLGKEHTICNLYLPPVPVTKQEISSLIDQL